MTDAYNTLQTFLGGLYVNDFNRFSHTWQVLIQAEPEFRNQPSDIDRFYVRSVDGNMVPLGTLASIQAHHRTSRLCSATTAFAPFRFWARPRPESVRAKPSTPWKRSRPRRCPPGTATNGPAPPISRSWRRDTKA